MDGSTFELRLDTLDSADVFVNGNKLPAMFTLNYNGVPDDKQKEDYLRTVAAYIIEHPESVG